RSVHHPHLHSFPTRRSSDLKDPYSAAKPPTAQNPRQPPCQLQAFPLKAYSLPLTSSRPRLEVPLTFLFFHRSRLIVVDHAALTLDRKSTRLNSSHVKISYAV